MARHKVMVSIDEEVWTETKRQIADINTDRRRGNKLTLSKVIDKMLILWVKVK